MCGINGLVKNNIARNSLIDIVKKMNFKTSYRGPDNSNYIQYKNACLGHNRLSIVDLTEGSNQPFCYKNLFLIFNGEIYNYKKIKIELINLGYVFTTNSDTEVVILSFDCWGVKCFDKFEGMFALSILDKETNQLYLARDFFGEKPLYYYFSEGNEVIFSSEINTVRDVVNIFGSTKLDVKVIPYYLKYLYLPSDKSPYENVLSLRKGHYLQINLLTLMKVNYKSYVVQKTSNNKVDLNTLKENLINSVGDQLVADVDVGLWLSGGIDSSLIAAIARKEYNFNLNTFTVKFSKDLEYNNEYKIAENVAKTFNHSITYLNVDYVIDEELINKVVVKQENLIANPSSILHELLCEKTSYQNAKVILTGLGGDEFFGGYNRYRAFSFYDILKNIKKNQRIEKYLRLISNNISKSRNNPIGNINRAVLKLMDSYDTDKNLFYDNLISYKNDKSVINFKNSTFDNDPYNELMLYDIDNYMLNDLLFLSDKFSMSYSFELRSPFLNKELFYNSFSLNSNLRMGNPGNKKVLFDWLSVYSDGKYKKQRKKGFTVSIEPYLRSIGKENMITLFKKVDLFDIVENDYIKNTLNEFYEGNDNVNNLYSLYYLSKWRIINNE